MKEPARQLQKMPRKKSPSGDELHRLVDIMRSSDDAIIGTDVEGLIFAWNEGAQRIYGYPAEEIKGRHFSPLIPPDRRQEIDAMLEKVRRGEHVDAFEARRVAKDGSVLHLSTVISPIRDPFGQITGASIITRDITHARLAEEALAQERVLLRTVIDNLTDSVYVKDCAGRYILDNPAHREFIGASNVEEVIGKTVFHFFSEAVAARYHADDVEVMRSGEPLLNREEPAVTRSGEERLLSTTKVPFRDSKGQVAGIVCLSRIVSAVKPPAKTGVAKPAKRT